MVGTRGGQRSTLFSDDAHSQPVLTGIRGFAALWVYLFHIWFQIGKPEFNLTVGGVKFDLTPPISIGFAGITLFFVLSGFLLSLPFAKYHAEQTTRPPAGPYLYRRILRVFPAYYAQLAILIAIAFWTGGVASLPEVGSFVRHLFMLFAPPPWGANPLNGVWWTLPIEFSFYLLLPVLAFVLKPGRWWWLLLGSLVLMVVWRHTFILRYADAPVSFRVLVSYQLAGSFDMFGMGMLAAQIHVNQARFPQWWAHLLRSNGLPILGLAVLVGASYWLAANRQYYWADNLVFYLWTPLVSAGTATLILSGMNGNRIIGALFGNRIIVFVGIISYSLYLWHLPIIDWLLAANSTRAIAGQGFGHLLLVSLPIVVTVSALSYVIVEKPCLRTRREPNTNP